MFEMVVSVTSPDGLNMITSKGGAEGLLEGVRTAPDCKKVSEAGEGAVLILGRENAPCRSLASSYFARFVVLFSKKGSSYAVGRSSKTSRTGSEWQGSAGC